VGGVRHAAELPTIQHRKQYEAEKDREPDHRITCVLVDRRYHRQGIAEIAIRGASTSSRGPVAAWSRSYPHDLTHQTKKMSSSFLYNGIRQLYERLGCGFVRPKGLKKCVMSIEWRRGYAAPTHGVASLWCRVAAGWSGAQLGLRLRPGRRRRAPLRRGCGGWCLRLALYG
jgi:hypothetical protein